MDAGSIPATSTNQQSKDLFLVSRADTNKIINSAYFFTQPDKYLPDSDNPIEEIRRGTSTGNVLAKAWYCAITTHDRYKTAIEEIFQKSVPIDSFT